MPWTMLATSSGLIGSGLFAWLYGGAIGAGVVTGFLAGAAVTAWGVVRQRRAIPTDPGRAMRILVEGFLVKLAAVTCFALVLGLVPRLRGALDWRAFVVAFGAAALVVLFPGTAENARLLTRGRVR